MYLKSRLLMIRTRNLTRVGLLAGLILLLSMAFINPRTALAATTGTAPVDHSIFDQLLKKYVDERGQVNYKGFRKDQAEFKKYLELLSRNPPAASWSKNEQMAYWINAYNAFTIQLILDHYPVQSIKDIGSKIQIPFVTTPWAIKFIPVGKEKISLDNIEHGTLRKKFDDPRIHFALVCASKSCPRLRNEAYVAEKLDSQLNDQGRDFLNNPAKNAISPKQASLSKYFDWYKGDWKDKGKSIEEWVNRYSNTKINSSTKISFMDYNWNLNEQ
ncbi:DUF547 domain-containing protein [Fibrisoma montanum]|uniref:DUF547 domain-containing protein n=2 Tax=Fibrisoma montanum TaxID=2305895 RepID=A0A418LZM8_9BACT|nr:DUF547 domain-containing protein [Fibrisoma montanum]